MKDYLNVYIFIIFLIFVRFFDELENNKRKCKKASTYPEIIFELNVFILYDHIPHLPLAWYTSIKFCIRCCYDVWTDEGYCHLLHCFLIQDLLRVV